MPDLYTGDTLQTSGILATNINDLNMSANGNAINISYEKRLSGCSARIFMPFEILRRFAALSNSMKWCVKID